MQLYPVQLALLVSHFFPFELFAGFFLKPLRNGAIPKKENLCTRLCSDLAGKMFEMHFSTIIEMLKGNIAYQ